MEKNKKRGWPFKFPESHFSQRKTGLQQDAVEEEGGIMAAFLFVCISVIRSRYQQSQHRFPVFRGQGPFCSPDLSKLCTGCLKNTWHGYMAWGWRWRRIAGTALRAEIEIDWNFTVQAFSWKLQAFTYLQSSKTVNIRQILLVQLLSMWEDRFLVLSNLHLPERSLNNSYNNSNVNFF